MLVSWNAWRCTDTPPDNTVSMNALVILLYFLLYSTVHHFSCMEFQVCRFSLALTSSSARGRSERPSRPLDAHHVGWGRVRLDLRAGVFFRLEDSPALVACTTLDPKNLRISASPSRWWRETERSSAKEWLLELACEILWDAGYLEKD